MKYALTVFVSLYFLGCSRSLVSDQSASCWVIRNTNGITVTCPDGSTTTVNDGPTGSSGSNGYSVGVSQMAATSSQCSTGGSVLTFFEDKDNNGTQEIGEPTLSVETLCNGLTGAPGTDGVDGAVGPVGTSSSVTVSVAGFSECSSGGIIVSTTDASGATSNALCNGATGPQGEQGPAGLDASSVSMVQFCGQYTTTYPTTFPEFAVCTAGELYGVYYDGSNAWLAKVVPGAYMSTSTSAPCNFTVLPNCIIQDN